MEGGGGGRGGAGVCTLGREGGPERSVDVCLPLAACAHPVGGVCWGDERGGGGGGGDDVATGTGCGKQCPTLMMGVGAGLGEREAKVEDGEVRREWLGAVGHGAVGGCARHVAARRRGYGQLGGGSHPGRDGNSSPLREPVTDAGVCALAPLFTSRCARTRLGRARARRAPPPPRLHAAIFHSLPCVFLLSSCAAPRRRAAPRHGRCRWWSRLPVTPLWGPTGLVWRGLPGWAAGLLPGRAAHWAPATRCRAVTAIAGGRQPPHAPAAAPRPHRRWPRRYRRIARRGQTGYEEE